MTISSETVPMMVSDRIGYATEESIRFWTAEHTGDLKGVVRRGLNVVVALTLILLLLPVMVLIAFMVRLTSPGPILYSQPRVGVDRRWNRVNDRNHRRVIDHGGKLFRMYKFRTMEVQPEGRAPQRWAAKQDPRVTGIGRYLRRFRLDELPQLFNVLVGDMNIVGPRPEQPTIFARLRDEIPDYGVRQRVLPGITGLAQVNQSYDTCAEDVKRKVQFDLEYIRRESPIQDLKILLYTLPAVVVKRGGW
jgi:lipopolysaccharide/colanic/teichoic acid biosynthesis glycosyltransferase